MNSQRSQRLPENLDRQIFNQEKYLKSRPGIQAELILFIIMITIMIIITKTVERD